MKGKTYSLAALLGATLLVTSSWASAQSKVPPTPAQPKFKTQDASAYGQQIAEYADKFDEGWVDAYSKAELTIVNAAGDKSSSEVTILVKEAEGGNQGLIRYLSPANVRGVAALTHEHHASTDESWLYLPSSRRVRRISGANRTSSFQGTEFTYEDIASLVPSRYSWKFLKETKKDGQRRLLVEARPTYKSSGYSKLEVQFSTPYWRIEEIKFYDKASRLLKTLTTSGWTQYHERFWRPMTLTMVNKQTKRESVIAASSQFVSLGQYKKRDGSTRDGLNAELFTRRALDPK